MPDSAQAWLIDPVIFRLGFLEVRWYGLMYVIGFLVGGQLLKKLSREGFFKPNEQTVDSLVTHLLFGLFLGARLAYVFIYNWDYYGNHLGEIFSVWQGGLSFHGAVVGLALGSLIFARKHKVPFLQISDSCVTAGAQGIFWGRMGNFINAELYGRITSSPIGMVFPGGGPYPRHPSQLYEAFGEGILIFVVLWLLRKRVSQYGILTAIFFGGYAIVRFIVEFFREADGQLGYYFGGNITMGQILCVVQFFAAIAIYLYARNKRSELTISLVK
jgi:phosphatidylglycerol:prolipoprotein diacylglycerol transferase